MSESERRRDVHYHTTIDLKEGGAKAYIYRADRKIGPFKTIDDAQEYVDSIKSSGDINELLVSPVIENGFIVLFLYSLIGETDRVRDMGFAKELAGNLIRKDVGRKNFVVAKQTDLNWNPDLPCVT
ncbi:MAG: hypothetical protein GWN14_05290 [candidate division Zixibacteria bacterium]|nr:hypothetical protein [candidate division Zixibacteria bacterium]